MSFFSHWLPWISVATDPFPNPSCLQVWVKPTFGKDFRARDDSRRWWYKPAPLSSRSVYGTLSKGDKSIQGQENTYYFGKQQELRRKIKQRGGLQFYMWWVRKGLAEVTVKPIHFLLCVQLCIKPLLGPLIKPGKALCVRMFTATLRIIILKMRNNLAKSVIRGLFVKDQIYRLLCSH